jgi:DNA-binding response OmpR family regulator
MTASVLIVDDSLTVRMDLAEAFQSGGFDPVPCATAADARQLLHRQDVDIIILDVHLPDADGVEFLQEVRTLPRSTRTPILLLSSEAEVKDRLRGLRTGADEYVGKPYEASYVVARARQLIGAEPAATGTGSTVLLIDDSVTLRAELGEALAAEGYSVITATTGEEGLRIAADRRPDAIVVDRILPGADGITVIRQLRLDTALRDVPCLLLTASTDREVELDVLDAGADAFVRKDEEPAVLFAKLAAVLRRSGSSVQRHHHGSLHGPKKILAVSGNTTYLDTVSTCLRADGYEVVQARSGAEALALLAAQPVDCILLDLLLSDGNGQETCHRIKADPAVSDTPVIVVNARDEPQSMLAGLGDGADDYISSDDHVDILKARVRAQLRRKHVQDENRRAHDDRLRRELAAAEARAAQGLAQMRAALISELEWKNSELEAFSYSVSHDLRSPLQTVGGFSEMLLEDYGDVLDEAGRNYLRAIQSSVERMTDLISSLLQLSHASRAELTRSPVDLSTMAHQAADGLRRREPDRDVEVSIQDAMVADGDASLLCVALENLIANAWKYTRRTDVACIDVGSHPVDGKTAFFVRDNGAGFRMEDADALFRPYGRLHSDTEFPGTGIGLATVHRIIDRHGGRIWATGRVNEGAVFWFTTEPDTA